MKEYFDVDTETDVLWFTVDEPLCTEDRSTNRDPLVCLNSVHHLIGEEYPPTRRRMTISCPTVFPTLLLPSPLRVHGGLVEPSDVVCSD